MSARLMKPGVSIGARRGEVVVCIPVYRGHEQFVGCLRSVLAHTPAAVSILICDDASPDPRSEQFVRELSDAAHRLIYLRQPQNVGFPANVNSALFATAPADVVVLNSDCVVAAGWFDGLREAANSDSRVATVTALTNNGTLVSVPARQPSPELPDGWTLERAAAAVQAGSLRLRPQLPTAVGHCMYIRRSAVELVGELDLAFTPGYGEEVDFSQRCLQAGLCHVLADDVLVFHHGGASFQDNGTPSPLQEAHERLLAQRYPYYHDSLRAVAQDLGGPLARALSAARRALRGLSVAIDARVLDGPMTGTQMHVLELIAAVARTGEARVIAIVPDELEAPIAAALRALDGVRLITRARSDILREAPTDVVHRPFQVADEQDLSFLAGLGERLVITNQDLIGYHNPAYFADAEAWEGYRGTTRAALSVADRVVFFSEHARSEALAEDLLEPGRASVVQIGVDHRFGGLVEDPRAPRGAERLASEAEAMLCIGTDFRHKNRVFALRVLEQLVLRQGWPGYLLLAGPRVTRGSSAAAEEQELARSPELAARVLDFGAVSEAEKAWLYRRAALVLYPTVYEGFGLVPFESADHDVPCLWAAGTSLSEVLPDSGGALLPWDAAASAERALALLREPPARERNLAAIRAASKGLSWDATATALVGLYRRTADAPATPAGTLERRHGLMREALSEDARRLIGPGGALPVEMERPLLALATHPQISAPMFRALQLGYRASYRLRRRGRRKEDEGSDAGSAG